MVNFCAVVGYSNRSNSEKNMSFYRISKILQQGDEELRTLSGERRREWIAMINRKDTDLSVSRHCVCSDHFMSGAIRDFS